MSKSILGRTQLNIGTLNLTEIVADKLEATSSIKGDYLTASKGLATNADKKIVSTTASSAEIDFLTGATSNIQTQLNAKQPIVSLTANRVAVSDGSGDLTASSITTTELDFLDGASSNIQTQITANASAITSNTSAIATKQPEIDSSNRLDATLIGVGNVDNQDFAKLTLAGDNLSATIPVMLNAPQTYLIQAGSNLAYNTSTTPPTLNATDTDTNFWDLASNVITNNNSSDVVVATTFKNKIDTNSNAHIGKGLFGYSGNNGQVGMQHISVAVSAGNYAIQQNSNGKTKVNSATGQDLRLCINNSEGLTVSSGKNVGIGTNAPSQRLVVNKSGLSQVLQVWESDLGTAGVRNILLRTPDADDGNSPFEFQSGNAMLFVIDSIDALLINSAGNVIVNTTFQNKPNINANAEIGKGLFGYSGNSNHMGIQHQNLAVNGNNWAIRQTSNGRTQVNSTSGQRLAFHTGNNERMRIQSGGNVGIGQTAPSAKLHINGECRAGSFVPTSDDRVKHFEKPTTDCLTKIMSLKPTTYQKSNELYDISFVLADDKSNLKEGDELRLEVGFIAQEVKASIYEEFSSSVRGGDKWDYIDNDTDEEEEVDSSDNVVVEEEPAEKVLIEQEYTLNYNNIFVVAVGAIQELKAEIDTLKERIAVLEQ